MLGRARSFFAEHGVMEVDCPALTLCGSLDAHIDLISTDTRYLITSPEYGMKRLLSQGCGDIYQLAHVYRAGEISPKHQPEFMMAEWYRVGIPFDQMIAETIAFCQLFLPQTPWSSISYREAFIRYAQLDPYEATIEQLLEKCDPYTGWEVEGRDALLNLILGTLVEPNLGANELTVLRDYPPSQAALAKTNDGVAERFEIYYNGVELANGYHELADAKEQRRRFVEANELRIKLGKSPMPIDELFLAALDALPECCGVAVGFDRLLMLRLGAQDIRRAIPFAWEVA